MKFDEGSLCFVRPKVLHERIDDRPLGWIQCYAVGTPWAYIYVGDEYPLAIHRQKVAVEQAYAAGLLGKGLTWTGQRVHQR